MLVIRCWACKCHDNFSFFTITFNGEARLLENSEVANLLSVTLSGYMVSIPFTFGKGISRITGTVIMLQSTSRILRLEPASQPQNLRAEPQKFERATARFNTTPESQIPTGTSRIRQLTFAMRVSVKTAQTETVQIVHLWRWRKEIAAWDQIASQMNVWRTPNYDTLRWWRRQIQTTLPEAADATADWASVYPADCENADDNRQTERRRGLWESRWCRSDDLTGSTIVQQKLAIDGQQPTDDMLHCTRPKWSDEPGWITDWQWLSDGGPANNRQAAAATARRWFALPSTYLPLSAMNKNSSRARQRLRHSERAASTASRPTSSARTERLPTSSSTRALQSAHSGPATESRSVAAADNELLPLVGPGSGPSLHDAQLYRRCHWMHVL